MKTTLKFLGAILFGLLMSVFMFVGIIICANVFFMDEAKADYIITTRPMDLGDQRSVQYISKQVDKVAPFEKIVEDPRRYHDAQLPSRVVVSKCSTNPSQALLVALIRQENELENLKETVKNIRIALKNALRTSNE